MKSAFLPSKGLLCLYDKQNKTWLLVNMEFLLSCSTWREIPYLRAPMYYSLFIVLPTLHPMYYSLFIMLPTPTPCIILYLSCSPPHPMNYSLFIMLPTPTPCIIHYLSCSPPPPYVLFSIYHAPPHPILEKVRQYNHNSLLELPHHIYISIRLKYNLQKFGFVYVNYVNEHKNSGTKSSQTKQRL